MQDIYEYDILAADQIRLLRLRPGHDSAILEGELITCRLIVEEEEEEAEYATPTVTIQENDQVLVGVGDYDAVSYFWGVGDPTTHVVLYDSSDPTYLKGNLPIKPNLEAALRMFRRSLQPNDPQYFWIDALCINQANKPEKSAQIQKMAHIYNQAAQVRVWLGKSSHKSNIAMEFVREVISLNDLDKLSKDRSSDFKWAAFRELMRSEWFNRRWIIQEIALAREATVYCGEKFVSWEEFKWAVSLFISRQEALKALFQGSIDFDHHPDYLGELEVLGAKVLVDTTNDLFRKSESGEVIEHLFSLEALMSTLTMFEASTPHDTVYAILWLAQDATPGSSRPAARYKENAHTPRESPTSSSLPGPWSISIPSINMMGGGLSDSPLVERFPSSLTGESQAQQRTAHLGPAEGKQASASKPNGFLKPGEPGRQGRARANSVTSLRRAEKGFLQEPDPIQVDYDKSVYDVCKDFLEFAIMRSKSLDIICRPWAPSATKDRPEPKMPSWIPHILGRPFELRPPDLVYNRVAADPLVGVPGRGVRNYAACGKTRAYNTYGQKRALIVDRALVTSGFVLDIIEDVGAEATGGIIPSSWLKLVGWEDSTEPLPESFWRTLVANRDLGGQKSAPAYFPLTCRWAFDRRTKGYHLDTRQLLNEGKPPREAATFLRRVQAVVWDRRLVSTKGTARPDGTEQTPELLALVPTTAVKGDLICILHGCSVPVVLRKKENHEVQEPGIKRRATTQPVRAKGNLKTKRQRTSATQQEAHGSSRKSATQSGVPKAGTAVEADILSPAPRGGEANGFASTSATTNLRTSSSQPDIRLNTDVSESGSSSSQKVLDEQYVFLGECYVHGMMAGEAYKHREDTNTRYQEFWLV